MIRTNIINDLNLHLKDIATTQIFELYTYSADEAPIIVIRDETADVEVVNFKSLKHELDITLDLIAISYEQSDEILKNTLFKLKEFKSNFIKKELNSISRSSVEMLEHSFIQISISLKFTYLTDLWEC